MTSLITGLPLKNTLPLGEKQKASIMAFNPQTQLFARVKNRVDRNSLTDLWSADISLSPQQPSIRDKYQAIPVNKYWINQEHQQTIQVSTTQIEKPVSIGKDPQAIALAGLGLTTEVAASEQLKQEVEIDTADNLTTVKITQTNLGDDSVAGIRYLVEFAPYGEQTAQKWQLVWAGEQFKCQSGRGHQDWSTELCL
jgi:hypothetical protein